MCQTQHIRLPHIEEEEEFDISNKTSPVEDDIKVEQLPTIQPHDIKNSVIRIKQIRTIFNPNTLTTKTTTTTSSSAYPSSSSTHRQIPGLGFTSSIKLNRLLKRGILRGANNNNSSTSSSNNNNQTSSSDTSSILQLTAAQIQKAQQKSKESNNTSASVSHVGLQQQASPAKMQAEQGSIGDLQKYHSRYLKNRRHTLANVR